MQWCPFGGEAVAQYHTHPNHSNYSDQDKLVADDNNWTSHMGSPDYNLMVYRVEPYVYGGKTYPIWNESSLSSLDGGPPMAPRLDYDLEINVRDLP